MIKSQRELADSQRGKGRALARGKVGMSLQPIVTLSEAKGL